MRRGTADKGYEGEEAAARYLRSRGYRVLERNYRCPFGELDIIAIHQGTLVFVEVKTQTAKAEGKSEKEKGKISEAAKKSSPSSGYVEESEAFGSPSRNVTPAKQRRLARVAGHYLSTRLRREARCRYDIVEVILAPDKRATHIGIIEGAFHVPAR